MWEKGKKKEKRMRGRKGKIMKERKEGIRKKIELLLYNILMKI